MHHIDSYNFGEIVVDGKKYTRDLIIYPDKVDPEWLRLEGHLLSMDDLSEILAQKPDLLIVGTGYSGVMEVPEEIGEELKGKGIEFIAKPTREACKIYNEMTGLRRVIAALHLTC